MQNLPARNGLLTAPKYDPSFVRDRDRARFSLKKQTDGSHAIYVKTKLCGYVREDTEGWRASARVDSLRVDRGWSAHEAVTAFLNWWLP